MNNTYIPENMGTIESTYIQFQNKINNEEVVLFRGAVINQFKDNILFHNHLNDKFRYSYPLIQYKRINGNAGILGINAGVKALEELVTMRHLPCSLGNRPLDMRVQSVKSEFFSINFIDSPVNYRISNWLPLNQENYQEFQKQSLLSERVNMLERILVGNILSFAKGVQIRISSTIICKLIDIEPKQLISYKGIDLMSFNATFQSNILLPQFIGLGKGASINHGIISLYKC